MIPSRTPLPMALDEPKENKPSPSTVAPKESEGEKEQTITSRVVSLLWGDQTGSPGQAFEKWLESVRKRSGTFRPSGFPLRHPKSEKLMPSGCYSRDLHSQQRQDTRELAGNSIKIEEYQHPPEISLWERLGNAAILDIESSNFSWDTLSSLHHTEHTTSENSEDEMIKALEVTVNSGGVVFFALFNVRHNDTQPPHEAAAVIKFASSKMATQSERLGYEFAKWLGVQTPQARVIHNSSAEWHQIKEAAAKARDKAVAAGDEVGEMTCSELLEALELSRCLFLMNYVHGSPLLDSTSAFQAREAAGITAAALGRVLMLDLILRNEDRLPCSQLRWRGNYANLMITDRLARPHMVASDEDSSSTRIYRPYVSQILHKERKLKSENGLLGLNKNEISCQRAVTLNEISKKLPKEEMKEKFTSGSFHVVAIDSGVPRRPPAGKRTKDHERYPKLVELLLHNGEYSSRLLYEISAGKMGYPGPGEAANLSDARCLLIDNEMAAVVHEFRAGFRTTLRDLQGFHLFLLTLYQKLDGLLRVFSSIIAKSSGETDKDECGVLEAPSPSSYGFNSPLPGPKRHFAGETNTDTSDSEMQKFTPRSSSPGSRGSPESASPISQDNWNGRYFKGSGEHPRSLRMTMKLRDFNKFAKVGTELGKEIDQWNELLRTDVIKYCQNNNFNTGFFEGSDTNIVVDAYELKVRLEHILERVALISDAANTEKPSLVTDNLFIGGALAARSIYTLQHLGITHVLCLCSNEIGQSDSQFPELFYYRNFSISDDEDANISDIFEEVLNFIDNVERIGGKALVHCFEGKSRSATVVLAYLILRKGYTLSEAWNMLKKAHRRAQPNDGFAKVLLDLDRRIHGKASMEWQQKKPVMKVCPLCGKNAGLSTSSLKLHLQKFHKRISSGSVDSATTMEIQKAIEALKISRGSSVKSTQKLSPPSFIY